ncbi:MAG: hypothetical protein ABIJ81_02680 [Patescibacteria group bacterium]
MEKKISTNDNQNKEEQRVYLALLLVAVVALFLGVWQLRNNIRLPFILPELSNQPISLNISAPDDEQQLLKNKDSDGDGLSDYDEIYVYGTSAFLKDTDSDGFPDNEEITSGHNPKCPAGQTCLIVPAPITADALVPTTTEELRELLKQSGVSDEQLAAIDDATLLQLYEEVASGLVSPDQSVSSTPPEGDNAPNEELTSDQIAALKALSGAELRTLLKQSGIESEALDGLDDEALKQLVDEVLGL